MDESHISTLESRQHAAVIGASFSGLLAARVLSRHFGNVTLIEKDKMSDRPETRPGQSQSEHLHGLLAKGLDILETMFPGLTQELIDHGAIYDDMGASIRWYQFGGYRRQFTSGLLGVLQSRPLLEHLLRRRVLDIPGVSVCDCTVVGHWQIEDNKVTALHTTTAEGNANVIPTDLVIDCTGRGSRTPKWLKAAGYHSVRKDEVVVRVGYSTRTYERREDDLQGARLLMSLPAPPEDLRSGYLFPIEGNRWMLTVAGWGGDYPPSDEQGLHEFVKSLPLPDIYRIVHKANPLSDIITYRFRGSQRQRYERLIQFPAGWLVMGDAVASFNPVYGQGMTSSAMQAEVLDECLKRSVTPLHRTYFKKVAKVIDIPWQLATGEDFRFASTHGRKPLGIDLLNRYVARVHRATHTDTKVYHEFLKVMNLMQPPAKLMDPRIMWRVLAP